MHAGDINANMLRQAKNNVQALPEDLSDRVEFSELNICTSTIAVCGVCMIGAGVQILICTSRICLSYR